MNEAAQGTYAFIELPKPVGYWMLHPQESHSVRLYLHHKPNRLHIWFTKQLLGWQWNDTNGSTPWGLNQALEAKLRNLNK